MERLSSCVAPFPLNLSSYEFVVGIHTTLPGKVNGALSEKLNGAGGSVTGTVSDWLRAFVINGTATALRKAMVFSSFRSAIGRKLLIACNVCSQTVIFSTKHFFEERCSLMMDQSSLLDSSLSLSGRPPKALRREALMAAARSFFGSSIDLLAFEPSIPKIA